MKGLFYVDRHVYSPKWQSFPCYEGVILWSWNKSFSDLQSFPCHRGYSLSPYAFFLPHEVVSLFQGLFSLKDKITKNISHSCFPVMGVILDHSHNHLVSNQSFPRYEGLFRIKSLRSGIAWVVSP